MDKKYWLFTVVDRYHLEETVWFYVYGNKHEFIQYAWMKCAEMAEKWDRKFDPMKEFYPYDWNSNTVYIGFNTWHDDGSYLKDQSGWVDAEKEIA